MPFREITDSYTLDAIVPYFQPIVDIRSERVWRYECLARLVTPEQRVFLPSDFLYLIERDNHVQQLAEMMFCKSAVYFEDSNTPWNINLDASDLENDDLLHSLIAQLANYPNPARVSVEVSADVAFKHYDKLKRLIDKSLHSGMGVFIDNLGKQSANIRNLMNLPLRGIKLDGSLLRRLDQHTAIEDFVLSVCDLAKERHMSIVAEHIEDADTLEKVMSMPIQYAQGFVFCEPSPQPTSSSAH